MCPLLGGGGSTPVVELAITAAVMWGGTTTATPTLATGAAGAEGKFEALVPAAPSNED